jgi:hypothetical protein
MKINYSEFCYNDIVTIDGVEVEPLTTNQGLNLQIIMTKLAEKYGTADVLKHLVMAYGEYEETEQCEQCGNWDTIINLEV